ncbi:MAG TPA: MOSC N-terminal beta barrel domain-containing protein [Jatrophihabitantaceae bacterium]|nr:MOSC N-terminal beta barrel domain-containing protein [Jatrophihabitantaceae bacterium]
MALTLTGINRHPVKSCRGEALASALVEPWGLAGDRRWMIVDEAGETITAREHPRMLLIRPELVDGGMRLTGPDVDDLVVPVPDGPSVQVTVFGGTPFAARLADDAAHAWFSKLVGEPARLVYQDDPRRRATNPERTAPGDCVSFADGYPLLLAAEESLAALNDLIAAGKYPEQGPVPMRRFRPSVVVAGARAWDEDHWRRLRIGAATFRAVKGCDRCVITTTDPDTAQLGKEPLASLAKHRRWDGRAWFAMNLVPDNPGATINVGDEVEILERVESDGPPR